MATVVATLTLAFVVAASAAAATTTSSTTAARACAGQTSISTHLTGSDVAFMQRFVPCVIKQYTGADPAVAGRMTQLAAADLKALEATSAHQLDSLVVTLNNEIGPKYCGKRVTGSILSIDSTPPPTLTPLLLAEIFGGKQEIAYEKTHGTVFGFAYARSVLGHDGHTRNPVAFVFVSVNCNTKPVKLR